MARKAKLANRIKSVKALFKAIRDARIKREKRAARMEQFNVDG